MVAFSTESLDCLPVTLTRPEVAGLLRLSTRSVMRLEQAGRLRALRLGRAVRYTKEEVERLLEGGCGCQAGPAPVGLA